MPNTNPDLDHARISAYEKGVRGRRRAVRRLLKYLPRRSNAARFPGLRPFAKRVKQAPDLWVYRGGPLIRAYYVGSVLTLIPLLGIQILLSVIAAIVLRCNLPILIALAFVTNPLTAAPIYYATFQTGRWILDHIGLGHLGTAVAMAPALALGGVVGGIALGGVLHLVTFIWSRWHERHQAEIGRIKDRVAKRERNRPVPQMESGR